MVDRLLTDTNIPTLFKDTLFDDFDVKRRRGNRSIRRRIEEWEPTESKPALLLEGPPGLGKTMLASALLNEYHEGYGLSDHSNHVDDRTMMMMFQKKCPVYFIQLAEWIGLQLRMFNLHGRLMKDDLPDRTEYHDIDQLLEDLKTRVKVLVIDDVGKEHRTASGFAQDAFDLLVRTRHNAGLTTIYTTNVPLSRWSDQYSESMQSLIERSSLVLDF